MEDSRTLAIAVGLGFWTRVGTRVPIAALARVVAGWAVHFPALAVAGTIGFRPGAIPFPALAAQFFDFAPQPADFLAQLAHGVEQLGIAASGTIAFEARPIRLAAWAI
jgi:hypothetical protein